MLPIVAISITLTTILLLFSGVPLITDSSNQQSLLQSIQSAVKALLLLDFRPSPPIQVQEIVEETYHHDGLSSILTLSQVLPGVSSSLDLSELSELTVSEAVKSLSVAQIQLLCILATLSLSILVISVLPFFENQSGCPPSLSLLQNHNFYRNPIQKRIEYLTLQMLRVFRIKRVTNWKQEYLEELATASLPTSKQISTHFPAPMTRSLPLDESGKIIKRILKNPSSPALKNEPSVAGRVYSVPVKTAKMVKHSDPPSLSSNSRAISMQMNTVQMNTTSAQACLTFKNSESEITKSIRLVPHISIIPPTPTKSIPQDQDPEQQFTLQSSFLFL